MNIKDIAIGDKLYYIGEYPGMRGLYAQLGLVSGVAEDRNQVMLDLRVHGTATQTTFHLSAMDVSPDKPATTHEMQEEILKLKTENIDHQNEILVLRGQAEERSRQLDRVKALADDRAVDIERLNVKLKRADNQILRHEESLDAVRKTNEQDRSALESLLFEKKTMAEKVALLTAELVEVKTQRDSLQKLGDSMADAGETELGHLREQAALRDQIIEGWEKRAEKDTSIITSLRSQIESLQSIQESMKMMQEGHAPLVKRLKADLHTAVHQREQHKQNSAFWRGQAIALGYVAAPTVPGITADKLAPTKDDRLDKIEMFLRDQFESFK